MNPAQLSNRLAGLFHTGAVATEMREPGDPALLLRAEAVHVGRSVAKRAGEFAAGRLCARRALAELHIEAFPLRAAQDRQPIWPAGVVGSITHTTGFCAAAVAPSRVIAGLGLDSEVVGAVSLDIWPSIAGAEELAWLDSLVFSQRAAAIALIFSAKEAFYKLQYPMVREHLSFHDVRVFPRDWGADHAAFDMHPTKPLALEAVAALPLQGRYLFHDGLVSTGISIARGS